MTRNTTKLSDVVVGKVAVRHAIRLLVLSPLSTILLTSTRSAPIAWLNDDDLEADASPR